MSNSRIPKHQSNQFDKKVILTNGYLFDKEADTVKLEPLSPMLDEHFTHYIKHEPLCPNNDQNSCKVNLAVNVEPQSSELKGNLTVKIEPLSFECGQNMTVETELQSSKDFENMTIRTQHSSSDIDKKVTVKVEPHSPDIDDAAETDVVEDVKLKTDENSTEYNSDNTIKIEQLFKDKVWSSERLSTEEKLATVTNQPTVAMIQHCGSDMYLYTPGVTANSETSTGTDTTGVLLNRDTAESCDMDSESKTINLNTQINSNDKITECQENGTNNTIHHHDHNKVIKRTDLVKGKGRFFTVENSTFRCLLCGKKFYLYFQYENHALRKHFPFSCILCDFCFQTKADAMSHKPCTTSHTTCETSHTTCETSHTTCETSHTTCETSHTTCETSTTPNTSSNTLCTTKQHRCSVCKKTFQKAIDLLKHCNTCVYVSGRGNVKVRKKTSHTFHKTMSGKTFDESDIAPVELTEKRYHRKEVILVDHVDNQVETSLTKSKKKNTIGISTRQTGHDSTYSDQELEQTEHNNDCVYDSGRGKVNVKDFKQEVEYFEASARKSQRINHKRKLEETEEQCWEADKFNKYQKSFNKLVTQFTFSENVHYTVLITGSYKCKICSENFKCLPSFSCHARSKHFPFECSICQAFFATMDGLIQHNKGCIYVMGKGYCCTMCKKVFPAQNKLIAHTQLNHIVYICFKCNCEFENQRKLDLHSQTCQKIRIKVL